MQIDKEAESVELGNLQHYIIMYFKNGMILQRRVIENRNETVKM